MIQSAIGIASHRGSPLVKHHWMHVLYLVADSAALFHPSTIRPRASRVLVSVRLKLKSVLPQRDLMTMGASNSQTFAGWKCYSVVAVVGQGKDPVRASISSTGLSKMAL
jgi:hypothetical protein